MSDQTELAKAANEALAAYRYLGTAPFGQITNAYYCLKAAMENLENAANPLISQPLPTRQDA